MEATEIKIYVPNNQTEFNKKYEELTNEILINSSEILVPDCIKLTNVNKKLFEIFISEQIDKKELLYQYIVNEITPLSYSLLNYSLKTRMFMFENSFIGSEGDIYSFIKESEDSDFIQSMNHRILDNNTINFLNIHWNLLPDFEVGGIDENSFKVNKNEHFKNFKRMLSFLLENEIYKFKNAYLLFQDDSFKARNNDQEYMTEIDLNISNKGLECTLNSAENFNDKNLDLIGWFKEIKQKYEPN